MRTFARTPVLRWLVPVLAAAVLISAGWTVDRITASAQEELAPRTAAQLLVDVQQARLDGLSGTIVQRADLGLPELPGVGGSGSSDLSSLISGSHTLRVWLSGPDKARLALMGTLGESDVVLNGADLWIWSSRDKTAAHRSLTMPTGRHHHGAWPPRDEALPMTPQSLAKAVLAAMEPSTEVTTSGSATVAGRRAYELVLGPRDRASLVDQVRIAIDAATSVPLRVQVFARGGASTPAFEVGFTRFDPTRPDDAQFRFTPPPGAEVTELELPSMRHGGSAPEVVGQGWTTTLVFDSRARGADVPHGLPGPMSQLVRSLPRVSGDWGSGRLLAGTLFSVLFTDDGRTAVGAVTPRRLFEAVAAR